MTSKPFTCRKTREGLTEYLEDALPPDGRQGVDAHLAGCDECRRSLSRMQGAARPLPPLPREPMPPRMKRELLQGFRSRHSA